MTRFIPCADTEVVVFLAAKNFDGSSLSKTLTVDGEFSSATATRLWDSGEFLTHPVSGKTIGHFDA